MSKGIKITLIVLVSIFAVFTTVFLLLPNFIDLNDYKKDIYSALKHETGADLTIEDMSFKTFWDYKVALNVKNINLDFNKENLSKIDEVKVKVSILPLIFKRAVVDEILINSPSFNLNNLVKMQNSMITKAKKVSSQEAQNPPDITIVLKDASIKNYLFSYSDKKSNTNASIKGEYLNIKDFVQDKKITIETKGSLDGNSTQMVTYNVNLTTQIPKSQQNEVEIQEIPEEAIDLDILNQLVKYGLKANINTNLDVKFKDTIPNLKGDLLINQLTFTNVTPQLPESFINAKFEPKNTDIDSNFYITKNEFIKLTSKVEGEKAKIDITSTDIKLNSILEYVQFLAKVTGADTKELGKIRVSGSTMVDVKANASLKDYDAKGVVALKKINLSYEKLNNVLSNFNSEIKLNNKDIEIANTKGLISGLPFSVSGKIKDLKDTDINVKANNIALDSLVSIAKGMGFSKELEPVEYIKGKLSLNADLTGNIQKQLIPNTKIQLADLSLKLKDLKYPVTADKIIVTSDDKDLKLEKSAIKMLNSSIGFEGIVANYLKNPKLDIQANGNLVSADIKKLVEQPGTEITAVGKIPVNLAITGTPEDLKIKANMVADRYNNIQAVEIASLKDKLTSINADINIVKNTAKITNTGLFVADNNTSGSKQLLEIQGVISDIDKKVPTISNMSIKSTKDINLDIKTPDRIKADLALDISAKGNLEKPELAGNVIVKNVSIPSSKMTVPSLNARLGDVIKVDSDLITINGANIKNLTSDVTLDLPKNLVYFKNTKASIDNGVLVADGKLNTLSSNLSLSAKITNVTAQSLIKLSQTPNSFIGNVSADCDITTNIKDPEQSVKYTSGNVSFKVTDATLGEVVKLEDVLKSASVVTSLVGIDLTQLSKELSSEDTSKFNTITGSMTIKNGLANISKIEGRGPKMSIYVDGTLNLFDSVGELRVLGRTTPYIADKLEFLGDVSLEGAAKQLGGSFGKFAQSYLSQKKASDNAPLIAKIPELDPPVDGSSAFQLKIKGNTALPSSIKSFKWLD